MPNQILEQNTVPALFLMIAMLEFLLIIMDRMIYSSKSIRLKLLTQWVTVLGFHGWIFFALPAAKQYGRHVAVTGQASMRLTDAGPCCCGGRTRARRVAFRNNGILPVWYFAKWVYWFFSARQVRPTLRTPADPIRNALISSGCGCRLESHARA